MLRRSGKRIIFISNNPTNCREDYAEKLTHLGMPATSCDIITSAYILANHLSTHEPDLPLYVVGEAKLKMELIRHGLSVIDDDFDQDTKGVIDATKIGAVVIGFDRTLDYRKLNTAYQALKRGARFFATNTDRACPVPGGDIPDAGAIVAYLEHLTDRKVELLAGKPSHLILQTAFQLLKLLPENCLLIGDRLETDIRMGQVAGMHTCLVLSGVTSREQAASAPNPPEFIVQTLFELLQADHFPGL
jgi:arabinose operon protein AraL